MTSHVPSPEQTKQVGLLSAPGFMVPFRDFVFPSSNFSEFSFNLTSSVQKMLSEGPADILSEPASLKKANSLFAH